MVSTMIVIERFVAAREAVGLSQAELARRAGVSQQTVQQIEAGKIKTSKRIHAIAATLGVSAHFLDPSIPADSNGTPLVPVVGYVGAGSRIFSVDDHQKGGGLEEVPASPGLNAASGVAVRVRGDSMYPAFKDGDLVFYDSRQVCDFELLAGKDCVVQLQDGRMYLKELRRTNGDIYLHSHNDDPIFQPRIVWAARVHSVVKA